MQYTYYTCSALRIPVKQIIKRTLTTMQITQFLVGFTFAALHLFVKYTVPVSTPVQVASNAAAGVSSATDAATSAAAAAPSSISSAFSAAGSAAVSGSKWIPYLHAGLLRAFGEEGLANNVGADGGLPSRPEVPLHEASQKIFGIPRKIKEHAQVQTHTVYQEVDCIDTAGQSFAVWLNLIYLAPLTVLFVRFFIRSYSRRYAAAKKQAQLSQPQEAEKKSKNTVASHGRRLSRSVEEAVGDVDRELNRLGKRAEDGVMEAAETVAREANPSAVRARGHQVAEATRETGHRVAETVRGSVAVATDSLTDALDATAETVNDFSRSQTPGRDSDEHHDDDETGARSSHLHPGDSAYGTFGASEIRESKGSSLVQDDKSYAEAASVDKSYAEAAGAERSYAEAASEEPPSENVRKQ